MECRRSRFPNPSADSNRLAFTSANVADRTRWTHSTFIRPTVIIRTASCGNSGGYFLVAMTAPDASGYTPFSLSTVFGEAHMMESLDIDKDGTLSRVEWLSNA